MTYINYQFIQDAYCVDLSPVLEKQGAENSEPEEHEYKYFQLKGKFLSILSPH